MAVSPPLIPVLEELNAYNTVVCKNRSKNAPMLNKL
jgi:hypothetical protein